MTFNNIEVLNNTYSNKAPNYQIYDGANIAVFHDGVERHMIIKNLNTAVSFKEPNSSITETSFIIGSTSTRLFFANPNTNQLRSISNTGTVVNEQIHNLNYFNKYRDLSFVGNNTTQNIFKPTCGNVFGETIVVGGTLLNASAGLTVANKSILTNAMCYMYSDNSGETFQGPFFPFLNNNSDIDVGHSIGVVFVNDNYYFVVIGINGQDLSVVQSLGVDLIGDSILAGALDNPANSNNYQLPIAFFDNKIFFQDTNRSGYYTFNLETDNVDFTVLPNITTFSIIANELRITTLDSCTPTVIVGVNNSGANVITSFILNGEHRELHINVGKVLVQDTGASSSLYNGTVNSDHFLQPASIETSTLLPAPQI